MAAWRSPTACWARGCRCGTGSASATAGRCSATPSGSWPPTGRRRCWCAPGAGRSGWPRGAVVAVRAVPPAPPRRASLAAVARLEGLCADAWPAVVDRRVGRVAAARGGRFHRSGQRRAGRRRPGPADRRRRCGRRASSPPSTGSRPGCTPRSARRGTGRWPGRVGAGGRPRRPVRSARCWSAPLDGSADPRVELAERPPPDWWRLGPGDPADAGAARGGRPGRAAAPGVRAGPRRRTGRRSGTCGRPSSRTTCTWRCWRWPPPARRQGLARALVAHRRGLGARSTAARWAVLQVAVHNTDALACYDRLGFVEHHRYRYLVARTAAAPAVPQARTVPPPGHTRAWAGTGGGGSRGHGLLPRSMTTGRGPLPLDRSARGGGDRLTAGEPPRPASPRA